MASIMTLSPFAKGLPKREVAPGQQPSWHELPKLAREQIITMANPREARCLARQELSPLKEGALNWQAIYNSHFPREDSAYHTFTLSAERGYLDWRTAFMLRCASLEQFRVNEDRHQWQQQIRNGLSNKIDLVGAILGMPGMLLKGLSLLGSLLIGGVVMVLTAPSAFVDCYFPAYFAAQAAGLASKVLSIPGLIVSAPGDYIQDHARELACGMERFYTSCLKTCHLLPKGLLEEPFLQCAQELGIDPARLVEKLKKDAQTRLSVR